MFVWVVLAACGGETGENEHDSAAPREGGRFDVAADVAVPDVKGLDRVASERLRFDDGSDVLEDGGTPIDADFGDVSVPPPPADAAHFYDKCDPNPCDAGQICINEVAPLSDVIGVSYCDILAMGCEPDPTCLCVVESVSGWCESPTCSEKDGYFVVSCEAPPPP